MPVSTALSAPIVILSEPLPPAGMGALQAAAIAVRVLSEPMPEHLAAALPEAAAIVLVNEQPALTAAMIDAAPRLRIACRNGAGFDNFDVPALTRRGIPLLTTGDANADAVAEHALHLLLALARRGPAYDRAIKGGAWSRAPGAVELRDKTMAVVGWGRIGQRIGRLAEAFGMRVLPVDPAVSAAVPLASALAQADAVVLAMPLTPRTHHLIDTDALARMKPSAFLVNVARGPVVDQQALAAALTAGRLAGAGLDVLEQEPPSPDDPLLALDNVVLSPHVAASCPEAVARVAVACAEAVVRGLAGRFDGLTVVNPAVLA
ncbi:D-3-phosphoglycerate dehydrogenase [Stella humosa]|uniref:D-3-phosphoglycerate dehydrogenase n=1 Tax=Stella humosa TaxID=94 RepID=A0A3N1KJX8_9PROT|nr:NAD(P)-dependent oxidoreductase [Stella humosa]ROP81131.1 D-3-phosphoglycerate dehydrogenase [Stella humosa]BBK32476.1 2-hydroxyacid dehydrogenase [Stella humosa]